MILRHGGRAVLEALRDLFFPLHCAGCETALESGWLCSGCERDLRPIPQPCCAVCSQPFAGAIDHFVCPNCQDREFHFETAVAVFQSRGVLREFIHRLKYGREVWLAPHLGRIMMQGFEDERLAGRVFDGVIPIPLHALRRREREFNQAELLARELSRRTGIPVVQPLLRQRNTVTQTHFDRKRRMQNLRDAFSLRQNVTVQGQNLLLVDDVFTTGSTLDECARLLLQAGAQNVCALTLARG